MNATSIQAIEVLAIQTEGSEKWLVTSCEDYDVYKTLPAAVSFQGQVYGRTGWNSDTGRAFYSTSKLVAVPVAGADTI